MRLAFTGGYGHGKTLMMTALGSLIAEMYDVPLYANYPVKYRNFTLIQSLSQLDDISQGVCLFDEFWETFDSRNPRANVILSRWINQTRKLGLITMATTQTMGQVDLRFRDCVDYLMWCVKKKNGFFMYQYDYRFGRLLRVFKIEHPEYWYGMYDRNLVVDVLSAAMPHGGDVRHSSPIKT